MLKEKDKNEFKNLKDVDLVALLNLKYLEYRNLMFLGKKNTKEFKKLKTYIARLNGYISSR